MVCPKCKGLWHDGGEVNYIFKGRAKERLANLWRYLWSTGFQPD